MWFLNALAFYKLVGLLMNRTIVQEGRLHRKLMKVVKRKIGKDGFVGNVSTPVTTKYVKSRRNLLISIILVRKFSKIIKCA